MNFRMRSLFSFALLMALFSLATPVSACACCAEPGEYSISFTNPRDYELAVLDRITFSNNAHLYTTVAGFEEDARGIRNPSENYVLASAFQGSVWRLTFRDGKNVGTLILPRPARMLNYHADIHDSPNPLNVSLYKEWRFEGGVTGTGIFQAGTVGATKYLLVFQGRGNNCTDESNFSHWRLEVKGKHASYAFYGELEQVTTVTKHAKGTFVVKISPLAAEDNVGHSTIGRMALDKQFLGDIVGTSKGQMLSTMSDVQGSAGYVAIERFEGMLDGRKGTFALQHSGIMNRGVPGLVITVIPDSGTGELVGISGTMSIDIADGKHFYDFEYAITKRE